jgi:hypothetical protein
MTKQTKTPAAASANNAELRAETPEPEAAATTEKAPREKAPREKAPLTRRLYEELKARKDALEAAVRPFRELFDAHLADPKFLEARAKIKAYNAEVGPVDNEMSALQRALGGRAMSRPETPE